MVTLREVTGDPGELAALQGVMESDEDYALRVTGHPPSPADAQSTLMFVPEGSSPDDKALPGRRDGLPGLLLIERSVPGATTSSAPRRS